MAAAPAGTVPQVVNRVAAALLGGWLFSWGFVAFVTTLAAAAGMPFGDAQTLALLLAFLVYLTVLLWGFAAASVRRVWLALAGGAALMTVLAWLLSRQA